MNRFINSFGALPSTDFLVKCRNIILTSDDTAVRNKITYLYSFFPCLTLSLHVLIIFKIYIIEIKLDFVSFNVKEKVFKGDGNLLANVTFSYKTLRLVNV